MVFGPNMQNFREIVAGFLARLGAVQVRDAAELESTLAQLLGDSARREELGRNALQVVRQNLGAVERTVELVNEARRPMAFDAVVVGLKIDQMTRRHRAVGEHLVG